MMKSTALIFKDHFRERRTNGIGPQTEWRFQNEIEMVVALWFPIPSITNPPISSCRATAGRESAFRVAQGGTLSTRTLCGHVRDDSSRTELREGLAARVRPREVPGVGRQIWVRRAGLEKRRQRKE